MWGFEPADSAITIVDLFHKNGLKEILIPGYGYGRNANIFADKGFRVTGIEISKTAIELAKKHYGDHIKVFHGSVIDMPFDKKLYDGIFCYALIHLLDENERLKFIDDCYKQLRPDGYMAFVAISKKTASYGEGEKLSADRFLTSHGVKLFFYDSASVKREFGKYGLLAAHEIKEPLKNIGKKPSQIFWQIICKKEKNKNARS